MEKYCDNLSVGVILTNEKDELALLTRGRFPIGIAPPAGHIDTHGSLEQAAIDEVYEELGVVLAIESLRQTSIASRRVNNVCRREGGDHHIWTVYESRVETSVRLAPDPEETKGAKWYTPKVVRALAARTRQYQLGNIDESEWTRQPGLEPVWVNFMEETGYLS